MRTNKARFRSLFLLVLMCCTTPIACATLAEDLRREGEVEVLRTADVLSTSPRTLELNRQSIRFDEDGDGAKEEVRVILVYTGYKAAMVRIRKAGDVEEHGVNLGCYELRSLSDIGQFSWTVCSSDVLGHFRLFMNDDGKNYLAWVGSGYAAYYVRIDGPRDRVVAVTEFYADQGFPQEVIRVPVKAVLGRKPFRGTNALYSDIFVESIEESKGGTITVKLMGHDKDKVYTLVKKKGGEWYDPEKKKE